MIRTYQELKCKILTLSSLVINYMFFFCHLRANRYKVIVKVMKREKKKFLSHFYLSHQRECVYEGNICIRMVYHDEAIKEKQKKKKDRYHPTPSHINPLLNPTTVKKKKERNHE